MSINNVQSLNVCSSAWNAAGVVSFPIIIPPQYLSIIVIKQIVLSFHCYFSAILSGGGGGRKKKQIRLCSHIQTHKAHTPKKVPETMGGQSFSPGSGQKRDQGNITVSPAELMRRERETSPSYYQPRSKEASQLSVKTDTDGYSFTKRYTNT